MSIQPGLYYLKASPATEISSLYATGNGVNKTVTVHPHTKPFIEHQVVSTRHLHVFWMVKTANTLCQCYSVAHQTRRAQGRQIPHHPPHRWKYLWRTLVPEGRKTYSWGPRRYFGTWLRLVHFVCGQGRSRHHHVRIRDISLAFLHNVPHHQFFSIRASTHLIGVTLYGLIRITKWTAYTLMVGLLWLTFSMLPGYYQRRSRCTRCRGTLLAHHACPWA